MHFSKGFALVKWTNFTSYQQGAELLSLNYGEIERNNTLLPCLKLS